MISLVSNKNRKQGETASLDQSNIQKYILQHF